ncbi:anti-sigma factor domain-containing protein [Streptomyces sp. NPDC091376]|uniref:anti-sigma factor n=1 Tax=Streptomyces sp. NPDC091376 TaxID=3365994 RepID=UPI0038058A50
MSAAAKGAGRDAELHTLTGAYALNALGDRERARFERHLDACPACEQEVRELGATAARLGLAVADPPMPAMKSQVLARIATVRQEPPTVAGPDTTAGYGHVRTPVRRARPAGRRRFPRFVLAACLAAVAGLGGVAFWQQRAAEDAAAEARKATTLAQQRTEALADVLTATDVRTTSTSLGDGATGTVAVSRDRDQAVFLASGLPEPGSGKVYQLWFADDGTMRPAGLLESSGAPEALLMDGPVDGATGMGITVEPAGGSTKPTTTPLGLLNFPAV